jgi:alkanesulfonate monooxygenase SsuD/methylene tetrahydromethanopterin reductase-like flavin-dependent oxidoreductase (luciferase family)
MRFSLTLTFNPVDEYVELTKLTDELGWYSVNIGDGLFFFDETSVDYPYSDDGARYWSGDTPFPDPFAMSTALAMITEDIRFFVNVLKLPVRDPMLVAKMAGTVSYLSGDRFSLGVGLSPWPEDYTICGQEWKARGPRCGEMIEILRKALTGEMFEHHGRFYDIPTLCINPVPRTPMPIFVGGTATPVLKRAAKLADGFVSPNTTAEEVGRMAREIDQYRKEYGTDGKPFEMISVAIDTFDLDGHRRLAEMGVTEACVVPWFFYGGNFHSPLDFKKDAVKRFTDQVISKM